MESKGFGELNRRAVRTGSSCCKGGNNVRGVPGVLRGRARRKCVDERRKSLWEQQGWQKWLKSKRGQSIHKFISGSQLIVCTGTFVLRKEKHNYVTHLREIPLNRFQVNGKSCFEQVLSARDMPLCINFINVPRVFHNT